MKLFARNRRRDVPMLDINGAEATVIPRTAAVEEPPPVLEAEQPRHLKLPETIWA
jgi:hypothetical protein